MRGTPHVTVELDVVVEPLGARQRTLEDVLADMTCSRSYVDADTDRTSCCVAEEVWLDDQGYYGCDRCQTETRRVIQHEVVLVKRTPTGWPLVAFHGPRWAIESMLERHGYEDGLETYLVEE